MGRRQVKKMAVIVKHMETLMVSVLGNTRVQICREGSSWNQNATGRKRMAANAQVATVSRAANRGVSLDR